MEKKLLTNAIFNSIASKRILKTGFVGQPGGIYQAECDSVAAHSTTVSILASTIAFEIMGELESETGISINFNDIVLMALYHDYGETRSLDTGSQSKGIYPEDHCKLHHLEREGLETLMEGTAIKEKVISLFDSYRKYDSIEAIIVHIADNLEGFEKAIYSSRGNKPIFDDAKRILAENLMVYSRKVSDEKWGLGCSYLVNSILIPGVVNVLEIYNYDKIQFFDSPEFANLNLEAVNVNSYHT